MKRILVLVLLLMLLGTIAFQPVTSQLWGIKKIRNLHFAYEKTRSVIMIHNVYELQNISKNLSGNYVLANDINASVTKYWNGGAGFIPIGSQNPFKGIFNGNGHKIINLWINQSMSLGGLFADVADTGVIENVSLINEHVSGSYSYVGGLVGCARGPVKNVYVSGELNVNTVDYDGYVGGILGTNGNVSTNLYSDVDVYVQSGKYYTYVGGLIGINFNRVTNSSATGSVYDNSGGVGFPGVGGLVGKNAIGSMINRSYSTGNVTVIDCYNGTNVGGLVGWGEGFINNSYSTGNVYVEVASGGSNVYVGGLVGEAEGGGEVVDSYCAGELSGGYVGGLVAHTYNNESIPMIGSFWDVDISGVFNSAGGVGKSTDEMMNKSTFLNAGWDFYSVWDIWDAHTYPFLKWSTAPRDVTISYGSGYVNLTWEKPLVNVKNTISEFEIYRNGYLIGTVSPTQLWFNDTGVKGNNTYSYYVTAVNSAGESERSNIVVVSLPGVPLSPRDLQGWAGNGYVYLSWTAPYNGGAAITEYRIYRNGSFYAMMSANRTWFNDTSVVNGVSYSYYVTAVNSVGESERSNEVNATPMSVPDAPSNLRAEAGNGYVYLTWDAPSNGGSAIVHYSIYRNGTLYTNVSASQLWYNDTSVINGVTYSYYVVAVNSEGVSNRSNEVSAMPMTVPNPPGALSASVGGRYVYLTWNAPYNGGSPIKYYRIYRNGTLLAEVNATQTWYNDTSVVNGVTYSYYVTAVNSVGEGARSNEVNATPMTVPDAPQGLSAHSGSSYVSLIWNPPASNGGSSLTAYRIYRNGEFLAEVGPTQTWYNDTSVSTNNTYSYYVTAVNSAGEGARSNGAMGLPVEWTVVDDFSQNTGIWDYVGNAYLNMSNRDVVLTDNAYNEAGIVWLDRNINASNFIVEFRYYSSGPDGLVMMFYKDRSYLPEYGGALGFLGKNWVAVPGYGIEFDAYQNVYDPSSDHVALIYGNVTNHLKYVNDYSVSDGHWHDVVVHVYSGEIVVYEDGNMKFKWVGSINRTYSGFGFAGATGGLSGMHMIDNVRMWGYFPPARPTNFREVHGDGYVNLTWAPPHDSGGSKICCYVIYRNGTKYATVQPTQLWFNDTHVVNGVSYSYSVVAENSVGESVSGGTVEVTPMTVPDSPGNLSAYGGDSYVNLSWEAPYDGGSNITEYRIYRNGSLYVTVSGYVTSYQDFGVVNGYTYSYYVTAVNSVGESERSNTVYATPMGRPDAPENLSYRYGNEFVNLTWRQPYDGGSVITEYRIYRNGSFYAAVNASRTWFNDTSVVNGITYTYYVTAVNSVGESAGSNEVNATPMTVPSAPTNLAGMGGKGFANLTWAAPYDGGSKITEYIIYRDYVRYAEVPGWQTWFNDTGVNAGTEYSYFVVAVNSEGAGPRSDIVLVRVPTVPSAPGNLTAYEHVGYITLTWNVPASNGWSTITGYRIYRDGVSIANVSANVTSYADYNVSKWTYYTYYVTAINSVGESKESNNVTAMRLSEPQAPWNFWGLIEDNATNLSWYAPKNDGGSPITEYQIYRNGTLIANVSANQTWYQDTGLINGVTYTYYVVAVNAIGASEPSLTLNDTPMRVPNAPGDVRIWVGNEIIRLTWSEPYDGGSSITGYNIYRNGTFLVRVSSTQLWYNDTSVVNGVSYSYFITAVNSMGESPSSSVVRGTPRTVPDAPYNLTYYVGDRYVYLTWNAPYNGGANITAYYIYRNGTFYAEVDGTQTWFYDDGLINGVTYSYYITAVNVAGESNRSVVVYATPMREPDAPGNLTAHVGNEFVNLTWRVPYDGGSAITEYRVYRNGTLIAILNASQTWYNDTGLVNGITYTYYVTAVNSVGESDRSNEVNATPMRKPDAPYNLQASWGDMYIYLTWNAPYNGGANITEYRIYRNGTLYVAVDGSQTSFYDGGLVDGVTYTYYVTAVNCMGESLPSNVVSATPMTVPSAPVNLTAVAGNEYVYLSWEAPYDGGSKITAYRIYRNGTLYTTVNADQLWFNDNDVVNGVTYSYYVTAVNSVGEGSRSRIVYATPMTVPDAPSNLMASAGDSYVYLTWDAPYNGGANITAYYIYRNGTFYAGVDGTQTWFYDDGLVNGVSYTYYVTAVNQVGESARSRSVTATPMRVPDAPGNLTARCGNQYANLTWDVPYNGGSRITEYRIYRNGTLIAAVPGTQLWYNDTGLVNGITYAYYVTAVNSVGESARSNIVYTTPVTVPSPPVDLNFTSGDRYVNLTWSTPYDGGAAITGYLIYRNGTFLVEVDANRTWYNDTGLVNGVTYTYYVTAVNSVGESAESKEVNATPMRVPDAPSNLSAEVGAYYIFLSWSTPYNGGSNITGYRIYRDGNLIAEVPGWQTWFNDTHVDARVYMYYVTAVNAVGESKKSEIVQAAAYTAPAPPWNLAAHAGNGYVLLTWKAPLSYGGSMLEGYRIYKDHTLIAYVDANRTWYNDTGLANGYTYSYYVTAVNAIGESAMSNVVNATPVSVPEAPYGLTANMRSGMVYLQWDAPSDGGARIYEYRIYRNGKLVGVADGSALEYLDATVHYGVRYTYYVTAVNRIGESDRSNAVSITPVERPALPGNLRGKLINGHVNLTWTAPFDGGSPIQEYRVYRNGKLLAVTHGYCTWYDDSRVEVGKTYTYYVTAVNSVGESNRSNNVTIKVVTVPGVPGNLTAVKGRWYVNLSWNASAWGGTDLIGYQIYRNGKIIGLVPEFHTWYNDTHVVEGAEYHYYVVAVNSVGASKHSNTVSISMVVSPSAPLNVSFSLGEDFVNLTWDAPEDDGGSAIVEYLIYRNGTLYAMVGGTQLWYNDTNVSEWVTYEYYITALNSVGESNASITINCTPESVPEAPENLSADVGEWYVNLTWTVDNESHVAGFIVYRDGIPIAQVPASQTWYNDTNVSRGRKYVYCVSAVNEAGVGVPSDNFTAVPGVGSGSQLLQRNAVGALNLWPFVVVGLLIALLVGAVLYMRHRRAPKTVGRGMSSEKSKTVAVSRNEEKARAPAKKESNKAQKKQTKKRSKKSEENGTIHVHCPVCGYSSTVPEELRGTEVQCPECGTVFTIR